MPHQQGKEHPSFVAISSCKSKASSSLVNVGTGVGVSNWVGVKVGGKGVWVRLGKGVWLDIGVVVEDAVAILVIGTTVIISAVVVAVAVYVSVLT
jgi:hypothetical protein